MKITKNGRFTQVDSLHDHGVFNLIPRQRAYDSWENLILESLL